MVRVARTRHSLADPVNRSVSYIHAYIQIQTNRELNLEVPRRIPECFVAISCENNTQREICARLTRLSQYSIAGWWL